MVQVLGNMSGGVGKKSKKKKKNPWESDGSGVPSWAQEVPWSDGSSAEQFDAIKKDELMEQIWGAVLWILYLKWKPCKRKNY